jgi:hypothetical protein
VVDLERLAAADIGVMFRKNVPTALL